MTPDMCACHEFGEHNLLHKEPQVCVLKAENPLSSDSPRAVACVPFRSDASGKQALLGPPDRLMYDLA